MSVMVGAPFLLPLAGLGFSFINFLTHPKYFSRAASCSPPQPQARKGRSVVCQGRQQSLPVTQGLNQRHPAQATARLSPEPLCCPVSWGRNFLVGYREKDMGVYVKCCGLNVYMCLHTANPLFFCQLASR